MRPSWSPHGVQTMTQRRDVPVAPLNAAAIPGSTLCTGRPASEEVEV
jgi:hypothetical protein